MKYLDWTPEQTEALLDKIGGKKRAEALLVDELVVVPPGQVFKPSILKIDRTNPFDPAKFIGESWSIWRGPKDGNGLEGDEEQDARSLAITELDLTKLITQTGLEGDESKVAGEVKLARLLLKAIQADAKIAQALCKEKGQTNLRWLHNVLNLTWIEFSGTTLRSPYGQRHSLCLYRFTDGSWGWGYLWLNIDRSVEHPTACFEQ